MENPLEAKSAVRTVLRVVFVAIFVVAVLPQPSASTPQHRTANASGVTEPLIIDVNGDALSLAALEDGVAYDLRGEGQPQQTAWIQKGSDDAFLVVDVNNNGKIDANELVGGMSPGPNGFATLRSYDGVTRFDTPDAGRLPPDGQIDEHDALFAKLVLWTDANHDGLAQESELESLAHAGVTAIYTGYMGRSERDCFGNVIVFDGRCSLRNARGVEVQRTVSAVRFANSRTTR